MGLGPSRKIRHLVLLRYHMTGVAMTEGRKGRKEEDKQDHYPSSGSGLTVN